MTTQRDPLQKRPIVEIHVTPKMINRTLEVWEPLSGHGLSQEEARDIIVDMGVFFRYLLRWDEASRRESRRLRRTALTSRDKRVA